MQNPIVEKSHREIKEEAEIFYKKIGSVWCPALNYSVRFDEIGFTHLQRKGRKFRAKNEQKRRFALLPSVENILISRPFSSYEERIIGSSHVQYWKFMDRRDANVIKVVVRQVNNGPKHFLSVYSRKQKPAPESADL